MKNYLPVFLLLLAIAACKKNELSTPHTLYRYDYRDTLVGSYAGKLLQIDYEWRDTGYVLYKKTLIDDTLRIAKPQLQRVQINMLKTGQSVSCVFPQSYIADLPNPVLSYSAPDAEFMYYFTVNGDKCQVQLSGWRIKGNKKTTWANFESPCRRYIKGEWKLLP